MSYLDEAPVFSPAGHYVPLLFVLALVVVVAMVVDDQVMLHDGRSFSGLFARRRVAKQPH